MSGGSYDYKYREMEELADMLSPTQDSYQSIRDDVSQVLRELSKICHDIEWIDSGDYGEEDFEPIIGWLDRHNFLKKTKCQKTKSVTPGKNPDGNKQPLKTKLKNTKS